jgi:crossover junction endonuclease MUS81
MIIKVDIRENDLYTRLKNLILFTPSLKDIQLTTETLPIGDIIISDEKHDKLIIERKCINDLLASIKDGRYEEQSYRLNGLEHHNHNIYYLIEGDINKMNNRFKNIDVEKMTVYSAIFSLNYYKGFSVMRTFNIDESAIFICNTANKLKKTEKLPFYKSISNIPLSSSSSEENTNYINSVEDMTGGGSDKDYVNVVKKVKKENITEDNIGEIMLCQIPGISSVTSLAIMEKFKTISNLITQLETNNDILKDISYTNTKGQIRKINKTSILNLIKFLCKK